MKTLQMSIVIGFGVLFSILILIVLSILLLNRAILSSNSPKDLRHLVELLAPPKDLYDYLINEELNISEKGLIKRFEFKNKYAGSHGVGIILDKYSDDLYFKPLSQRHTLKLKMEVNFYLQNSLISSRVVEDKYNPFIGPKGRGSGFSFFIYDSPEDLPLNQLITCEVKIIEPDSNLYTAYGPVRFYIRKISDL